MNNPDYPPGLLARARRRVRRKLGFLGHATVFIAVHAVLATKHWFTAQSGLPPVLWGWGLALSIHAAWVWFSVHGENLRERMLRQEIQRLQKEGNRPAGQAPTPRPDAP
jgi:hypothetical protein